MNSRFQNEIKCNPERYEEWKKLNSFNIMKKYNTDPEYKKKMIENNKKRLDKKREDHYKRWDTDEEYRNSCKARGMRDCRSRIRT